jgi:hypothetical protein
MAKTKFVVIISKNRFEIIPFDDYLTRGIVFDESKTIELQTGDSLLKILWDGETEPTYMSAHEYYNTAQIGRPFVETVFECKEETTEEENTVDNPLADAVVFGEKVHFSDGKSEPFGDWVVVDEIALPSEEAPNTWSQMIGNIFWH